MFLTDYILGLLEDNTGYFIGQDSIYKVGLNYGEQIKYSISSQPILQDLLANLVTQTNPILVFNLYVISTLILNLLTAFFLFKKYHSRNISPLLAITYSIAPFIIFKAQNHPSLVSTWVINLGLFFILNHKLTIKRAILVGVYIAFATLASNYYGYFLILFAGVYYGVGALRFFVQKKWSAGFNIILKLIFSMLIAVTLIVIAIFPYIKANYFGGSNEIKIGKREVIIDGTKTEVIGTSWQIQTPDAITSDIEQKNPLALPRSIEDFTYFTSRPWYYVLPPKSNPFFGEFTGKVIDYMQSIPGNWLAQNYFMREHSASYLGWANIILAIIGLFYLKKNPKIFRQNQLILILITIFVLFLFTMPPYFTISGNKIYMPSYLLYLVFPMFRSLTRLGIVILPLFMIFVGYGYQYLFSLRKKYIGITIASIFFIFTIAEFIVPIKITPADYKAGLFIKLNDDLPKDAVLAFLPEEDSNIIVFNINRLKRPVINPKGYNAPEFGFNAETFTDNLTTCKGILEARNLGVTHILVYGRSDKQYTKQRDFLRTSSLIQASAYYPADFSEIFTIKMDIDYQKEKEACSKIMDQTN